MSIENKATFTLTKEVKERWIAALRSGEYKQGKHKLETSDGFYCCLGVLQMVTDGKVETCVGVDGKTSALALPSGNYMKRVFDDLEATICVMYKDYGLCSLAWLNDSANLSFKQIADLIEEQVETR